MKIAGILSLICLYIFVSAWHSGESHTQASLGEKLFSDPILSSDNSISCASCHIPEFAFSDTMPLSKGIGGAQGNRNTPSVMNMKFRSAFFWDGRAKSLAEQALFPIENPLEMNLPVEEAIRRLNQNQQYVALFQKVFGEKPTRENLGLALAAFEETLETSSTPFDRWMQDEEGAMSEAAIRGRSLFMNKGRCFDCHSGSDFTNDEFRNIGIYDGRQFADRGRFEVTGDSLDMGKFKVPGLRNVAITAPYMHNGMFKTLKEVVEYYNDPSQTISHPLNPDSLVQTPLNLTDEEVNDLVAFMEALTDDRFLTLRKTH